MADRPTLTVGLQNFGSFLPRGEWHRLVDLARHAEDAGVDRVVLVDHVVMGPHTDAYAWGRFPTPPDAPFLEPMTLLAAMAAVTTRVRLATGILIAPLRPAVLLAKQAATLDVVARGRLDLGVGTGWQREEYEAEGLDFARRGALLTDTLLACKALWRDTPAAYRGETLSFTDVYCEPKPVQPDGVPVWIGGSLHARNLDRIVRAGDGWIPIMGASVEDIAAGGRRIHTALQEAGRDPDRFELQAPLRIARGDDGAPSIARSIESVGELVDAGATDIHVYLSAFCRDADRAPQAIADIVAAFRTAA